MYVTRLFFVSELFCQNCRDVSEYCCKYLDVLVADLSQLVDFAVACNWFHIAMSMMFALEMDMEQLFTTRCWTQFT